MMEWMSGGVKLRVMGIMCDGKWSSPPFIWVRWRHLYGLAAFGQVPAALVSRRTFHADASWWSAATRNLEPEYETELRVYV